MKKGIIKFLKNILFNIAHFYPFIITGKKKNSFYIDSMERELLLK